MKKVHKKGVREPNRAMCGAGERVPLTDDNTKVTCHACKGWFLWAAERGR